MARTSRPSVRAETASGWSVRPASVIDVRKAGLVREKARAPRELSVEAAPVGFQPLEPCPPTELNDAPLGVRHVCRLDPLAWESLSRPRHSSCS